LLVGIGLIYGIPTYDHFKNEWDLASESDRGNFSQLYFNDTSKLPATLKAGKQYAFSFTVENSTNTTQNYAYQVYTEDNGNYIGLQSGNIVLNKGQGDLRKITFKLKKPAKSQPIVVSLPEKNLSIRFWATSQQPDTSPTSKLSVPNKEKPTQLSYKHQ
jgi:hypothetical protein